MSSDSKQKLLTAAIAVIIALLALNIYLFISKNSETAEKEKLETKYSEANILIEELNEEYDTALKDLDDLRGDNEELNLLVEEQKEVLAAEKQKIARMIRSGRSNKKDLEEARAQIAQLTSRVQQQVAEISALRNDKEQLIGEVENVKATAASLRTEVEQERTEKAAIVEEKTNIETAKAELEEKASELEAKVKIGSVLKVDDLIITPIKGAGAKEKPTKYARKTDRLEVCFTVKENKVIEPGRDRFYLRLLDPLGQSVFVQSLGSGETDLEDGSSLRYSLSEGIDYKNQAKDVCMSWAQESAFSKGNYTAEIYNKGYLVGSKKVLLK